MKNEFEDLLSRKEHIINLYDVYNQLLTDKQRDYFESYYYNDMSLSEISELKGVSRNAVFSSLKQIESTLNEYEEKLHLFEKSEFLQSIILKYENSENKEIQNIIKVLKEME